MALTEKTIDDNATSTAITIDASQNVGIGTSAPEAELHIAKSTSGGRGGTLVIENSNSSILNNEVQITFLTDSGASLAGISNARIKTINTDAASGAAALTFTTWSGSAEGERMRIDGAGRVAMPYQPAFRARGTSAQTETSGWKQLLFTTDVQTRTSAYNSATSRFTAPISGWYQFNTSWTALSNADNDGTVIISVNDSVDNVIASVSMPNTSQAFSGHSVSGCAYITANDYVTVQRYSSVTTTTRSSIQYGSYFSGYLIG